MQHGLAAVHVLDEALDAARIGEVLALAVALVDELDLDAVVEERELADALGEDLVVELDAAEGLDGGHEVDLGAAPVGVADLRQRRDRLAATELHLVDLAVAPDPELQPVRQRIDDRDTDSVQTAGHLVAVVVELAAGVELRHHDLGGRALELVVVLDVGGDAAAVVDDRNRVVGVDDDLDIVAPAGERLVDRVVEDLEHHVVEARPVGGVADVHPGALAHRVEPLQYLDARRVVVFSAAGGLALCRNHCNLRLDRGAVRAGRGAGPAAGDAAVPARGRARSVRCASA